MKDDISEWFPEGLTHKPPHYDSLGYFLLKVRKDEWRIISKGDKK